MDKRDLQIDTFTDSSRFIKMRVRHIKSSLCVDGADTSVYRLRKRLIDELERSLKTDKDSELTRQ